MLNIIRNYRDYSYYYNDYYNSTSLFSQIDETTIGIIFLISIIVSVVVYFTFLSKSNEHRFKGFTGWLYQFLNFGKLMVEGLLKITYMLLALFFSVTSIVEMTHDFLEGFLFLVIWNVILRVVYEFALIAVMICKNTSEINRKLKNQNTDMNLQNGNGMNPNNMQSQQYGQRYTQSGQPYSQGAYGQQPYGQSPVNRSPMGMQQPMRPQQPMQSQQPMGMQQPMRPQQPMQSQQPTGMQEPIRPQQQMKSLNPMGTQHPVSSQQQMGEQKPITTTTSEEKQQVVETTNDLKNTSCPNCGYPIEEDDMFCPNCGTKVGNK